MAAWGTVHSAPQQPPWGSPLFARNSATSFVNTIPIPFSSSVRITLTYTGNASSTLYYQAHGSYSNGATFPFGGNQLDISARLVIQRNALVLPRLAYLPIVNFTSGSGLIAAMAIAFSAPNLNTLEGCFNLYPTSATPFPGELHSTGTEDEFISSYYFDQGAFQGRDAGVYYKTDKPGRAEVSMWRSYNNDPMVFTEGGAFVWRNGDTSDPKTGVKCNRVDGTPAGDPQAAAVQTISWTYVLP